ncbi:cytidylyltransferase domain-containing protein [Vibrio neptunius]|uniref:acylneuraminate cytidylyltransferase family protein n=1 Tax=Vibrio neptunius TaxID=170651 RepID=UPI0005FA9353|nr:acylneuraminate cytidylyltransferase family protein [Vibrio neptunius]
MKFLAIIPARGGSKGVKDKNIRDLDGIPVIQYTIDAIKPLVGENLDVVVSTDSEKIALVAKQLGVSVLMRPDNLASDSAPMAPVVQDVLDRKQLEGHTYDAFILLQPTCPFRQTSHIKEALEKLEQENYPAVTSFRKVGDTHPARMYRISDGNLCCIEPESEHLNRQDLPVTLIRSGLIYAITTQRFLDSLSFHHSDAYPLIIDGEHYNINIDEMLDFYLAEAVINKLKYENC